MGIVPGEPIFAWSQDMMFAHRVGCGLLALAGALLAALLGFWWWESRRIRGQKW